MRLIDADKAISDYAHYGISHSYDAYDLEDILAECPTVEAIPKDQYEARLKADMVAMLEEIDLQFDEICFYKNMEWKTVPEIKAEYKAVIREKINALKEDNQC